jgi:Spy/CpxP family protein refolding chaperone
MSPKTRTYIGVGALLFCLIVGGGIVWWFLFGSGPKKRTVTVDPAQQTAGLPGGQMRMAPRPRDLKGVNKLSDDTWFVRGDSGAMRVSKAPNGTYDLKFTLPNGLNLSREQIGLLSGRFRILQDPLMAKQWQVTDDQTAKLKAMSIGGGAGMQPSGSDREAIRQLWDGYTKATDGPSKMDAQKKLLEKLDAVAKGNVETARKRYTDQIDQIRQILTPEQVKQITQ